MSRHSIVICVFAVASLLVAACGGNAKRTFKLEDSADSLSYVVGMNIAYNIMQMDSTMRADAVMAGIEDVLKGTELMSFDDGRMFLLSYMNYDVYERVRNYEEQYLADLAASDNAVVRANSGLTYKVGELGDMGQMISSDRDTVAFTYRVTNMAGKEVDRAEERADTLRTQVGRLQDGLREGVKLIGQGGKITLWIPSSMAYGSQGDEQKEIEPNEMLRYELNIVEVKRRR
ncbi:MAG: FKBP-type peptidyl-prolyl cis-trans isomerase [Alistipes sp.]|nr:FKBP-type peptidyl-prolyl cis-trans isomerase [Alistipes sp.]